VAYLATATPKYTATATIVIDTRGAHPVGNQQAPADWQSESSYIESQGELMHSPATLRGVVESLHLDQNPLFAPTGHPGPVARLMAALKRVIPGTQQNGGGLDPAAQAQARAMAALSRMLSVARVGTTSVVNVGVTTTDRTLSAELANAVTEAYMAQQLVAISETTRRAGDWLHNRIGELREQAVTADRAVQEYKAEHGIVDVGTASGVGLMNEQELGELNSQVAAAQTRVADAQARYERAKASTVDGVSSGMLPDALRDPVMTTLLQQYSDAARRETDLRSRMGPNHGAVLLQHKTVQELQGSIQAELARLTETYRGDFEVAEGNLKGMQAKLDQQVKAAAQTNIQRSELRSLESSAQAYRQIYESFLQRFTQAMQDQSYPISDARVAAVAVPPMDRSAPRTPIVLAVALTLGTMLGTAIAVMREALDSTVRTVGQLMEATGLDCLGVVPRAAALVCRVKWRRRDRNRTRTRAKRGALTVPSAFRQAALTPDSAIAQAVHAVRVAAARQSARGREVRVIGCVSVASQEGTSTFAANLAFDLACSGQRTALVDWNAETPWLTKVLSPANEIGVHEVATGEATLREVGMVEADSGLRFIGQALGGRRRFPPKADEVRNLLADLRDQNDVVVLDLPPMQASSASLRLCDLVDGFVLVTRWGSTPQSLLSEMLARAGTVDALFLGAVLSRCAAKRMRMYPRAMQAPAVRQLQTVSLDA
jgi:succinoglycan biosynthesis transport protein ExoP